MKLFATAIILLIFSGCKTTTPKEPDSVKVAHFEGFYEQRSNGVKVVMNDSLEYTFGFHGKIRLDDVEAIDTLTHDAFPAIKISFKKSSYKKIGELYKRNLGKKIALFINDELINLPEVNERLDIGFIYLYQTDAEARNDIFDYLKRRLTEIKQPW